MGMLPPVVATLLADTKEYTAKMDEAQHKMNAFGKEANATSGRFNKFASSAATGIIGIGAALGGYALDKAFTFQEGLDKLQNQAGLTAAQANKLGDAILKISSATGATTPDLLAAGLAIEQAGVKGARAQQLLNDASKASVITGQNVVDTSKAIVAIEQLQIAKGTSLANLTGELVAGAQHTVGGMTALAGVLQGRVGVALANTGMKLKDVISLGAEFSTVGLQSRSAASFATALAKLQGPLTTLHVTTKKTYSSMSTYGLALKTVGLSQAQLASTMRTGGLPALLNELKDAAAGSTPKLQELLQVVFGSTGAGAGNLLIEHLKKLIQVQKEVSGSGSKSLATGFQEAIKQLGPQLHLLEAKFNVLMVEAGKHLLPALSTVETWALGVIKYFENHPLISKLSAHAAGDIFAAAVVAKLVMGAKNLFFGTAVAANTGATTANTEALMANTAAQGGSAAAGVAETGIAGGMLGRFGFKLGSAAGAAGIGGFGMAATGAMAGAGSYMGTDWLLHQHGNALGNLTTRGGKYNPINDLATTLAGLLGMGSHPTAKLGAGAIAWERSHPHGTRQVKGRSSGVNVTVKHRGR